MIRRESSDDKTQRERAERQYGKWRLEQEQRREREEAQKRRDAAHAESARREARLAPWKARYAELAEEERRLVALLESRIEFGRCTDVFAARPLTDYKARALARIELAEIRDMLEQFPEEMLDRVRVLTPEERRAQRNATREQLQRSIQERIQKAEQHEAEAAQFDELASGPFPSHLMHQHKIDEWRRLQRDQRDRQLKFAAHERGFVPELKGKLASLDKEENSVE